MAGEAWETRGVLKEKKSVSRKTKKIKGKSYERCFLKVVSQNWRKRWQSRVTSNLSQQVASQEAAQDESWCYSHHQQGDLELLQKQVITK